MDGGFGAGQGSADSQPLLWVAMASVYRVWHAASAGPVLLGRTSAAPRACVDFQAVLSGPLGSLHGQTGAALHGSSGVFMLQLVLDTSSAQSCCKCMGAPMMHWSGANIPLNQTPEAPCQLKGRVRRQAYTHSAADTCGLQTPPA